MVVRRCDKAACCCADLPDRSKRPAGRIVEAPIRARMDALFIGLV
jgi:hypothetical protein